MVQREVLSKTFYTRDTSVVARDLLGKRLIRVLDGEALEGILVETEAYYGLKDPASRAFQGMKRYNQMMWREPGRVFIYNVHMYWMLNIVAHKPHGIGAVLIRALEPTKGIEVMRRNRPVARLHDLTSGPGKLTTALNIDKTLEGVDTTDNNSQIKVKGDKHTRKFNFEIGSSNRIGVRRDLEEELRFFIKGNDFVSK